MKVLVPLNHIEHIKDYIEHGAGEFYIGFYDANWTAAFGEYADINRMSGFKEIANPYSIEEVLQVIEKVKAYNAPLYVAFNSSMYSREQLVYIKAYLQLLKQVKVDGVIVSTMELVYMASSLGIPSVISTIAGVYNEDIARFYYGLGAKRIILPRDLSIQEILSIMEAVPQVEYEVFMMRNGCAFSDGNCLGFHRKEKCSICRSIANADQELYLRKDDFNSTHAMELNHMLYNDHFHMFACGLCAIYDFVCKNVSACKIVGRSDEWQAVCADIYWVKENVEIAKKCSSREEYLEKMIFPEDRGVMCKMGLSCYYPEVRF